MVGNNSVKKKYKVVYERKNCIGAGSCISVFPERWKMDSRDDKADLLGGKEEAKGKEEWFVGGITDENPRIATVDFSFLPKGKDFIATIYEDGKNAHWDSNPQSYNIRKVTINSKTLLKIQLASSGGVAISVR